ncbi:hypothetical protein AAFP35_00500 [Gordonia sp. CPCC 206044]|uniref:hypothetical protein n=1 Tax=Gordonia sp. CPCC 206044 TaxID=3140793 RepID=UPI003AF38DB0
MNTLGKRALRRTLSIVTGVLLAAVLALGSGTVSHAQIDTKRGVTGQVMLAKQADCKIAPNGLTARDAAFTVFSPNRVGANVRTKVMRLINGKSSPMPGVAWSGWRRVTPVQPVQFPGGDVWTMNTRVRLEVGHLVEFWGLRGGLLGSTAAVQNRYLTVHSGAPDFGSLGPWLPVHRFCDTPPLTGSASAGG